MTVLFYDDIVSIMIKKYKIPLVTLNDERACRLIAERAKRENRSRRNALITTVIEALGNISSINTICQDKNRQSFRDNIVEKGVANED